MDRFLNMIVRRVVGRLVNKGVDAGIDAATRGRGNAAHDQDRQAQSQIAARNAKVALRMARRIARF